MLPGWFAMHESRRAFQNAGCHPTRLRARDALGGAILLVMACVLVSGSAGRAQSNGGGGSSNGGQGHPTYSSHQDLSTTSDDDLDPVATERRVRALNIQRQKQMVADADKLLKLVKDLNDEVAKENTGTLTPDELHKIADIEKLARSVRQRMTDTMGQGPSMLPLPPPVLYPNH
jgi:hypothetical protein